VTTRILVVDDDDVGRSTLADILRLEGMQVQEASGGADALRRLEQRGFDVMLLDLKMPDISGLEVLEQTARLAPTTQVILFTAHGSIESAIQAVRHRAHDYLLKPVATEAIVESVRRALERRKAHLQREQLLHAIDEKELALLPGSDGSGPRHIQIEELRLDLERRSLSDGRRSLALTPAEMRMLLALLRQRGQVVSHGVLVAQVQGYEVEAWEAPGMVRPLISRLRHKLEQLSGRRGWITTVRGIGYSLGNSQTET
jgi:two-component system OmpR family response regulator